MNIRPITSVPKAITFAGSEARLVTRKKEKPLFHEDEVRTLAKLGELSDRQILAVEGTTLPWYSVSFKTSRRNRISHVWWMKDGSSEINVEYPNITIKRTGTTIERARQVAARHDIISHLNRIMDKYLSRARG